MFDKKRLRNYGLWIAVIALLLDIGVYTGIIPSGDDEALMTFGQRVLEVLVFLGILSNPTRPGGKGFNL